ncbi:alpha/beta fold hydrolase [Amycolatopsis sp. cg5]|uniref:alpha/beta fold hydrolase n=1 Tax=Amycolatopsis sp. cg5 TaxID=3238802 RepID=UPI00352632B0
MKLSVGPVREGLLPGGLPVLTAGQGPPLVVFRHFAPNNANPVGFWRWTELRPFAGLMRERRIHLVSRKPGLDENVSMAELAAQHATALSEHFSGPVDVVGVATGGLVAQQLAADRPDLLRKLVLIGTACRLGQSARTARQDCADHLRRSERMAAYAALGRGAAVSPLGQYIATAVLRAMEPIDRAHHPPDLIAVMNAEITFDLTDRLPEITAPTLLVAGDRDAGYPLELIRLTADRIPDARLVVLPRRGRRLVLDDHRLVPAIRAFLDER